jgi:hypothetical protein
MKKHVFLSYCRDNLEEVARLHAELCQAGESVWWDQDILPGQLWKEEIRQAIQTSYAVLLCLSQEAAARTASGIYPEMRDAIEHYRLYAPGSIFLIPVRLSPCPVPALPIDATRTLHDLQYEDLFPDARRVLGLQRLLRALQRVPGRPQSPAQPATAPLQSTAASSAAAAATPAVDPAGPAAGDNRVLRGGGWINVGWFARSAQRDAA